MVKQIILLVVILVGSFPASSQSSPYIKIGINNNSVLRQYGYKDDMNGEVLDEKSLGVHLGIGGEIDLSKHFSFNPEIQLIQKALTPKDYYLEFVTLFSYSPIKNASIDLGPSSGILLFSEDNNIRLFDVGANIGLTYRPTQLLRFAIRFNHSMFPVYKEEIKYVYLDPGDPPLINQENPIIKRFNRNFQFSIGYRINGK